MASTEERAYEIMRELDVSYVLVIFGGLTGYSSDGKDQVLTTLVFKPAQLKHPHGWERKICLSA